MKSIIILPFQPEDQEKVKELILDGLAEHWGELDPTKNPDLNNIAATYAQDVFLVAWLEDKIVGTGALVNRSDEFAEIVRMSVVKEMRKKGVGRLILEKLIKISEEKGYQKIILETTNTWHEVIEFYLKCGFKISHEQDGNVYFEMILPQR
jgi:GNAT superfamily N-acetyltransferase